MKQKKRYLEKIKNISITNFKSIKHLELNDCNRINVFIGMPNAGKSNILEALGLFGSLDLKYDPFVRYNKNDELFFEGNIQESLSVQINNEVLEVIDIKHKDNSATFHNYNDFPLITGFNNELIYGFHLSTDNILKIASEKKFFDIKYLNFNKHLELRESFNQKDSKHISGYDNLGYLIAREPELRDEIKRIFNQSNLKFLVEKNTEDIKIFKEYQDGTVFILPYNMIADTLQRLIYYKSIVMGNWNSVLLFEEPEAHCFEPYILEFTNSVKYDKNDNQFFIVTHSDFIIQEFLRDEESKQSTNIYLVNNVNGETKVKLLEKGKNEDVYELGMNPFFNFETLWENN